MKRNIEEKKETRACIRGVCKGIFIKNTGDGPDGSCLA